MRPKFLDIDPIAVDADGIAESQTPAAGGVQSLTLNGALADLGTAGEFDIYDAGYSAGVGGVQIGITSVDDETSRTFTVTGIDYLNRDATEEIDGLDTNTAESTTYWKKITSITVDDDTTDAITVGTVDEVCSVPVPLNWRALNFEVGLAVDVNGTVNYTVQHTLSDIFDKDVTPKWFNHDTMTAQTTDQDGNYVIPITASRLVVNSYSTTPTIDWSLIHGS